MASHKEPDQSRPLDPGAVQRRHASGCRCVLFYVGIVVSLLVGLGLAKVGSDVHAYLQSPHAFLYQNQTLEEVEDLRTVVRPLVDENQKFDIVATVWAFNETRDMEHLKRWLPQAPEDVVFSDVVFRGVTIQDKHVHTQVNLSIPLGNFRKELSKLHRYDLRASFVLIPQSPSLLDNFVEHASWRSYTLFRRPVRPQSDPSAWNESHYDSGHTVDVNAAIDSYGVSTPLIEFHPVEAACSPGRTDRSEPWMQGAIKNSEYHPYVVTRTSLRVVKMTKLYNARAFRDFQRRLRKDSTLNGCPGTDAKYEFDCERDFEGRANGESRIDFLPPGALREGDSEETKRLKRQSAYAPFLYVDSGAWGPLDVVPLPCARKAFLDDKAGESEGLRKQLNVVWNVAFSGTSPGRHIIARGLSGLNQYNMSDTEYNRAKAQGTIENLQRLTGQRFTLDGRPGCRLAMSVIEETLTLSRLIIMLHYWWTCTSTVGISIVGSLLMASGYTIEFANDALSSRHEFWMWLVSLIGNAALNLAIAGAVWKAILRLELSEQVPYFRRMPASHVEKTSWRLEVRGRTRLLVMVFGVILAYHLAVPLQDFTFIPALGPPEDPNPPDVWLHDLIRKHVVTPLLYSSSIYQIILNHRAKTFAGDYRLSAWLSFSSRILEWAHYVPILYGIPRVQDAFTADSVVFVVPCVVLALQAVWYPSVSSDTEDSSRN